MQKYNNIISGLLVSFIALPLCLAISTASGFPVLSGVVTAIVGGLVVSQISGARVAINGPAAGMIVVILDSVERLGGADEQLGYKMTLSAICVAALLQIATSFTKLPEKMRNFPESVIRGVMVSIGAIVILKQTFVIFGYMPQKQPIAKLLFQIPSAFLGMQIESFILSIFIILLIIFWNKNIRAKSIPIYLLVIVLGSILASLLNIQNSHNHLVPLLARHVEQPFLNISHSIFESLSHPQFHGALSFNFVISVFAIFAVGSLETVLSTVAVDKINPSQRQTKLKKDLRAIGIGNLICGSLGALPMITEIVRSSANVKYGGTTKWSNFYHGLFLLMFITIFSGLLKLIPLCVLASMLIVVGFGLVNLKLIKKMYHNWKPSLLIILSVVAGTICFDLLIGIALGCIIYAALKTTMPTEAREVQTN